MLSMRRGEEEGGMGTEGQAGSLASTAKLSPRLISLLLPSALFLAHLCPWELRGVLYRPNTWQPPSERGFHS